MLIYLLANIGQPIYRSSLKQHLIELSTKTGQEMSQLCSMQELPNQSILKNLTELV